MLANKTKTVVFVAIIVVLLLSVGLIVALVSVNGAQKENNLAQIKIQDLNKEIETLNSNLNDAFDDISLQEEQIKKYQEIFTAWTNSTPNVNEAIKRIMSAHSDVISHLHLFPEDKIYGLEDKMMDAIYSAIRSTEPLNVAKDFENSIALLNESRYDNIIKAKIDKIKAGGVTFPEDTSDLEALKEYFNSFSMFNDVMNSFVTMGLDKEIEQIEKLIDADEEDDLAKIFENAVTEIKSPITLETSLEKANIAWSELYFALETDDTLKESTQNARTVLDGYIARVVQLALAKTVAESINTRIESVKVAPDITTKELIESIEKQISAWITKFDIDKANMHLINDIDPIKKEYANALNSLHSLYEAFKKATLDIGAVNVNSKPSIDKALKAYEAIKDYKDTNTLFNLSSPNTVEELYALVDKSLSDYNYLVSLINAIRIEIDRIHTADPDITHNDIAELDLMVEELASLGSPVDVINTDNVNYVSLLSKVRLLPHKNDAFYEIEASYNDYYARANGNRTLILALVKIKDEALTSVDGAKVAEEINSAVEKAKTEFEKCFN